MKVAGFVEQARTALHAQGLAAFAQELVEAGVLEADDNPQQQPRRVEVEGVEVKGPDADGDLVIRGAWEGTTYVAHSNAGQAARALLAWVAAGEPQEEAQAAPEPAQGTRERPYLWRRKTESGGTEEVPVWLYLDAEGVNLIAGNSAIICLAEDRDRPRLVGCAYNYPGPKDSKGRAEVKVGRFDSDLPQPAAQPQPEAGEVVLRLTREEAEAVRTLLANVTHGGSSMEEAAARAASKLDDEGVTWVPGVFAVEPPPCRGLSPSIRLRR